MSGPPPPRARRTLLGRLGLDRPELRAWVIKRPMTIVEHASDWQRVVAVLHWFKAHPRPGIYLRQLDIGGVDTKFIETHRGLMSQLLDAVWGYGHDGYEHTVNSHINRLRAKIEQDPAQPRYVLTIWGVGYKFADGGGKERS